MKYHRTDTLLRNNEYMRTLLNEGGILHVDKDAGGDDIEDTDDGANPGGGVHFEISEGWIDEALSDEVTKVYKKLSPQDGAYLNRVVVVHNPALPGETASVEDDSERMRYILVTVVPDVPLVYELNFPIIQTMGVMGLFAWEFSRAATMASRELAEVKIAKKPVPPILNNARVDWISLYVGRKEYQGGTSICSNYLDADEDSPSFDVHLCRARDMEDSSVVMRLVEAYDADCEDAADGPGEGDNTMGKTVAD